MWNQTFSRINYIRHKIIDRSKDSFFNFTHAHLIRNMVTASELDLVKREPCDQDLILLAFYPTGGFGDYIISSKLLDEILLGTPCRIDVYCENVVFGQAVYGTRPGVNVFPYEMLHENRSMYDVVLCVEHFIHVWNYNAHHTAKISPEFAEKIHQLGKGLNNIRPDIEQQCYREAMHFFRSTLLGVNRWTELRHGQVFAIKDQYTYIDLKPEYIQRIRELNLEETRYITVNRGADSMGRSTMQTKVWPQEYYEILIPMFKERFPDVRIIQIGSEKNMKLSSADQYVLGENMEVTKWILRGSMLHIDCEGGLVHLATQLKTKCVVLFGPTPISIYGYDQNINLVSDKCSNCMGSHADWAFSCFRGMKEPECMYSLRPEIVLEKASVYLQELEKKTENKKKVININDFDIYETLSKQIDAEIKPGAKLAIVNVDRTFVKKHLEKRKYAITLFDADYGYSGEKGDCNFNRFTKKCMEQGIDARLGDCLNLPYRSEAFDGVVLFETKQEKRNKKISKIPLESDTSRKECIRVLKENGTLFLVNR